MEVPDLINEGRRAKGVIAWITGGGKVRLAFTAVVLIFAVIALWVIVYRLFFQGDDLAREHGKAVVTGEVANSAAHTTDAVVNAVQERSAEQQTVHVVVSQGRSKVNEAWHGETVGSDVDAAGRDALCRVHGTPNFCGGAPAATLQPVR